ncbi:Hypothetical protein NTJ_00635 [Nesidiocoris tenuis]|uniref:Uncharacterized protein n=1 Tax=Nesidiocoris tenuis TaxID=355587 RepID=A0ABN7A983_9HEMI|nr:Hypothetical protein NTJ_00635 [Nesidiocoris tenuis]
MLARFAKMNPGHPWGSWGGFGGVGGIGGDAAGELKTLSKMSLRPSCQYYYKEKERKRREPLDGERRESDENESDKDENIEVEKKTREALVEGGTVGRGVHFEFNCCSRCERREKSRGGLKLLFRIPVNTILIQDKIGRRARETADPREKE